MTSKIDSPEFYLDRLAAARLIPLNESPAKIRWNWRRVYKKLKSEKSRTNSKKPRRVHGKPYQEWRELVLANSNFRCVICDTTKNLQAHHIESYHANPHLRLDPDNGVTLCKRCHDDFHSLFGWRNNTDGQWRTYYSIKK